METDKIIKIKKKNELLNILIAGYLLIGVGIFSIISENYFGILFLIIGLIITTFKKGTLIDTANKQIIYYKKIPFYTAKKHEDISNVSYIALVRVRLRQQMNIGPVTGLSNYDEMQVKLNFITENKKVIPVITDLRKNIFPLAEKIAKGLKINIFDNTEGKKVWIKY